MRRVVFLAGFVVGFAFGMLVIVTTLEAQREGMRRGYQSVIESRTSRCAPITKLGRIGMSTIDEIIREALEAYRNHWDWYGRLRQATDGERELARMKMAAIDAAIENLAVGRSRSIRIEDRRGELVELLVRDGQIAGVAWPDIAAAAGSCKAMHMELCGREMTRSRIRLRDAHDVLLEVSKFLRAIGTESRTLPTGDGEPADC